MYNELAILKMTQSLNVIAKRPPILFKDEVMHHFEQRSDSFLKRLESWVEISQYQNSSTNNSNIENSDNFENEPETKFDKVLPAFPLLPGSKGFCISLKKAIDTLRETINESKLMNSKNKS